MESIFGERATVATVMRIEAALAEAQAELGIIPATAAQTIRAKAQPAFAPAALIESERRRVGHPLVAILAAWGQALGDEAAAYLHYGTTTPDIRLTQHLLQMRAATELLICRLNAVEIHLMRLSREHRATPMMGRTVGRHALPITFGMKTASWMAENRRNINRLKGWLDRTDSGVLAGAVGTYAALGEQGFEVERRVMQRLGLGEPDAADWKGTRDKHAEWGALLAIAAKSLARMAHEVFLLQGDDFRELDEANEEVGSSTMPLKANPRRATAVIALSRRVVHESGILYDWMISIHERDQINNEDTLARLAADMEKLVDAAESLLARLRVYPDNMRRNLHRTGGLIMAERVMFALGKAIGKQHAHGLVREAAQRSLQGEVGFREALLAHAGVTAHLDARALDELLDPTTYGGLGPQTVDRALAWVEAQRQRDADGPQRPGELT